MDVNSLLAHHLLALDVLRLVALALGGIVLGLSLFVFRLYLYARSLARSRGSYEGVGPYHVSLIAASHSLLVIGQIGVLIRRIGGEELVWWGAPISVVAFSCSIWALVDILRYENARVNELIRSPG